MMKCYMFLLTLLFLYSTIYSQTDSSAASFFPASVGNTWHYQYTQTSYGYTTTITRDSVANNSHFLFFDGSNIPAYKIDTMLNVISNPTNDYAAIDYKLTGKKNDTWIWCLQDSNNTGVRMVARIDDVSWGFVFGTLTQIKQIGYYYQPASDPTSFTAWQHDRYIAAGFGFYLEITDASQNAEELYGCTINGVTYGTMTAVKKNLKDQRISAYKLYPAFPNPFNPSTIISYYMPKSGNVKIKIYDILGKEISILIDGYQNIGQHSVRFEPKGLSSGVYFVRLISEKYSLTNKIIYSK